MSDELQRQLLPCPHCNGGALLKKRGNSISYWVARCAICRAEVKGTTAEDAFSGWNQRPTYALHPLPMGSYVLPAGQKYQNLLVFEDGKVSFIDYVDENIAAQVDVDLGHFRICTRRKDKEE